MDNAVEVSTVALASATTGFLLCNIGEVYRVIEQVTGVASYTHQLPRMGEELARHVAAHLSNWPTKEEAEAYPVNGDTHAAYAAGLVERFGETIAVPRQEVAARDPISELVEMVSPERVIVVENPHHD